MKILRSTSNLMLRSFEEQDVPILARWRSDERIMESYAVYRGAVSEAQVREEFLPKGHDRPRDQGTGRFYEYQACIVEEQGRAVAFVQYHRLRTSDADLIGYPRGERSYEMDLFVGDPNRWGRGLGTRAIVIARDFLREHRGAVRVLAVPYADNARSIRAFEKAGFHVARTLAGAYPVRGRGAGVLMEFP